MKNQQRLLVLSELFMPTKGGTAIWFDQVYQQLGGKEVHVITANVPGSQEHDRAHRNTIHRITLSRYAWLKPESLVMYVKFLLTTLSIAIKSRPDAIHAGRVLPEGLIAWIIAGLFRCPLVIYAHGEEITTWRTPIKSRLLRYLFRHADYVIANSSFTEKLLHELGVNEHRITLIHPGVDTEHFRPGLPCEDLKQKVGLQPGEFLLLSVGRLSRRKGFDEVIRALSNLKKLNFSARYALIGSGEDESYLRQLSKQSNVDDRIHFLGHVPTEDLPRWYNACDLFVMPNRKINEDAEGFGMVYIEAAACGKTAVSGEHGGVSQAVLHNQTGLNVDGSNTKAITEAIYYLLNTKQVKNRFETNALKRARERFSWKVIAETTKRTTNRSASANLCDIK